MAVLSSRKRANLCKHAFSLMLTLLSARCPLHLCSMLDTRHIFSHILTKRHIYYRLFDQNIISQVICTYKGFYICSGIHQNWTDYKKITWSFPCTL